MIWRTRQHEKRGKLDLSAEAVVMGILNVTPDSFSDGGEFSTLEMAITRAKEMRDEGAKIIDIGGESTRPGAEAVSAEDEKARVVPVIQKLRGMPEFDEIHLSVDTSKASVASAAIDAGADIVNDVTGCTADPEMISLCAERGVGLVVMHMQGTPKDMQTNLTYENVTQNIIDFFIAKLQKVKQVGIKDVIIDPGFGFGKTLAQNYQILQQFDAFRLFDLPLLAGMSRKSMICKLLDISPSMALNGTTATNVIALQKGANILRVHDVKEAMEAVKIVEYLKNPI